MREEPQWIAGRLEGTLRIPDGDPTAICVIAHPLPTHGGTMRNPLIAQLARAAAERGWYALRFNFRGVGQSGGEWSGGLHEHEDLVDAVAHARAVAPGLPLGVVGFSFGARTVLRWLEAGGRADAFVLCGLSLRSATGAPHPLPPVPASAVVVNGEHDEFTTPDELRAAIPQATVLSVPGADHFFTGHRDAAARIVMDRLASIPMTTTEVRPMTTAPKTRRRILTGDRPTGRLHLGHYVGTLANRVRLQDEYETFLLIADHHMLTTRLDRLDDIERNIRDVVLDDLSVGIDPEKVTIYLQSLVPQTAEIHLLFSMLVTVPRAQRIPTLKDTMRDLHIAQPSYGLLGYPILQAADILCVKGDLVPVGRDQESHIELTREIARRFNDLFGPVFPIPEALIPPEELLPGTDGQTKMGKSLGNAIELADDPESVRRKVMSMYTDPRRIRLTDPGRVEGNPVFLYHDAFNDDTAEVADLKERYRAGRVGDVEVKQRLVAALERFLAPIRERRARYERDPRIVDEILREGSERARAEAQGTLAEMRHAMRLDYFGQ